jgi:hypothetical protein
VRADSEYLDFYIHLLGSYESEFERIKELYGDCDWNAPGKMDSQLTSCLICARGLAVKMIERDKICRLIGVDHNAGYELALIWTEYADKDMRENAIIVFKEIGDKKSLKQLGRLSNDPDSSVSSRARRAIEDLTRAQAIGRIAK